MRVVHFSASSLAGAPWRLARVLRECAGIDARLVDSERYDLQSQYGFFEHDVVCAEEPDKALELARQADILHLHNEVFPDSTAFGPIDFRRLQRRGARIVRHFHSLPQLIARKQGVDVTTILEPDVPAVVIAQYPERFHPRARVVPNVLPLHDPAYAPASEEPEWDIFFSPSKRYSAWEERWNTKGAPETIALMEKLRDRCGACVHWLTGRPLAEVLQAKNRSRIVLDDMVNGSYHLSGLEGLAMGKCVCCWLDPRMERLLRWVSGEESHPFVSVRLEEARPVLEALLNDPELCAELGWTANGWMERCWNGKVLSSHFSQLYDDLMQDPSQVCRQPELSLDGRAAQFFHVDMPEAVWRSRAENE